MHPVRIKIKSGKCGEGIHKAGQVFIVKDTTPKGVYLGVWNTIAPYLTALGYGGNFPWEKEKGTITVSCPGAKVGIELRRIEKGKA
jgi:uncharacterized repeat protein (TIGR04076 family)